MLKGLIETNLENGNTIAYLNELDVTKLDLNDNIIIENEVEELIIDGDSEYQIMDDFNILVDGNVLNFSDEINF